ncbi:hypothetical protein EON65_50350 [archaeon]|nr:MAG: hypothetical protein EON65_50350 [archaeon]
MPFVSDIQKYYQTLSPTEQLALTHGKQDQLTDPQPKTKGNLLCVTFTRPSRVTATIIQNNIQAMHTQCDWAIIFHNGTETEINRVCDLYNSTYSNVIHCARSPSTLPSRYIQHPKTNASIALSTPKSVLYHDLLVYLPSYKKVFTLDDDISLADFDYAELECLWHHTFHPPPLVVQPLVQARSPQYLTYVNHANWQKGDRSDVYASGVGLVEQQVPIFDASFFLWYVRRVLMHTLPYSIQYGADWGHDRTWCRAARAYSLYVLNIPPSPSHVVCALLTKASPVFHLNLRNMRNKRLYRDVFRSNANQVLNKYIQFFPNWVSIEAIRPNNPLDISNRHLYPFVYNNTKVNRCME